MNDRDENQVDPRSVPGAQVDPSAKMNKFTPGDEQPATCWPHTNGASSGQAAQAQSVAAGMSLVDVVDAFTPMFSRARKELAHFQSDRHLLAMTAESVAQLGPDGMRHAIRSLLDNTRFGTLEKLNVLVDVVAGLTGNPIVFRDTDAMNEVARPLPPGLKEQSLGEFLAHTLPADAAPRRKYRELIGQLEAAKMELRMVREVTTVAGQTLLKIR